MADVQIITDTTECGTREFVATCGNTTARVMFFCGEVWVLCINASHKAYRSNFSMGKPFASLDKAVEAYKKAEMKAIIRAAEFA